MLYRKVDLRKLYEAMDEPVGMDNNPGVVMGDMSSPVDTAPQAAESFPAGGESNPGENKKSKEKKYSFSVSQEDYEQLTQLSSAGAETKEWTSSTPLKRSSDPNSNAMMEIGGQSKPVYLKIILTETKGERASTPLNLEDEDRVYVALMTSPSYLKHYLDSIIKNEDVTLTVKTPLMKSGTNVEHSLDMLKNFQSNEETPSENTEANMSDVKQIKSEQPGLAAQLDLPESRKRFVGGKWKPVNEAYKMVKNSDKPSNDRWLYDDVAKKAYPVTSPESYNKLVAKYKISDPRAVGMPEAEIMAAVKYAKSGTVAVERPNEETSKTASSPIVVDDLAKVEAGTVLKSGRTGGAVRELQTMLGIEADGEFGPKTKEAVMKFQRENGLKVDGIVGKNTLSSLRKKKEEAAATEAEAKAKAEAETKAKADSEAKAKAEAEAKAKADSEAKTKAEAPAVNQTDDKDLEDMSADELRAELDKSKNKLRAARQESRQEKRSERQDRRESKRDARKDRKEDRQEEKLRRRVEKIQKKIGKATNESKIYNFDEFVKIVHEFQSK